MATAMMLKTKTNSKLPLCLLRNPMSVLIRPVAPIPQPETTIEAPQLSVNKVSAFPLLSMTQKLFAGEPGFAAVRNGGFALSDRAVFVRQMGTSRSPRGISSKNEDLDDVDEDVEDFNDDDDDEGLDDFDEDESPVEDSEDDQEEEKTKRTKRW